MATADVTKPAPVAQSAPVQVELSWLKEGVSKLAADEKLSKGPGFLEHFGINKENWGESLFKVPSLYYQSRSQIGRAKGLMLAAAYGHYYGLTAGETPRLDYDVFEKEPSAVIAEAELLTKSGHVDLKAATKALGLENMIDVDRIEFENSKGQKIGIQYESAQDISIHNKTDDKSDYKEIYRISAKQIAELGQKVDEELDKIRESVFGVGKPRLRDIPE